MGDARKNIRAFPSEVRASVGYALQLMQAGKTPLDAKPFKGVGSGVYEIVKRYDTDTYRLVYVVKIGEKVYVLHAFPKKSNKGIKTPQADIDTRFRLHYYYYQFLKSRYCLLFKVTFKV